MPPFFGDAHFYSALQNEALPALERIAADDTARARSLKRFERDDPPPYTSSTESEELDDDPLLIPHSDGHMPQELIALTEPPLTDEEISLPAFAMRFSLSPFRVYGREAGYLKKQLRGHAPYLINPLFRDKYGDRRAGVLIRHYIRRRWEKLGIWNPEWGVPTRNKQPNDDVHKWRWKWEQNNPDESGSRSSKAVNPPYKGELLVARAMGLRRNLRRGESSPVVPRSHLPPDASASEAESFLMSRPWFIFSIEVIEESERFWRLDNKYRLFYRPNYTQHVVQWWKERGDWREKFEMPDGSRFVHSWKWRHESPSPEPDDLTSINNIKQGLSDAIDMDFTPSELDAFDAIPPLGYESPIAPKSPAEDDSHLPRPLFNLFSPGEISYNRQLDAPQEPEIQPSESQQNASATPQDSHYQLQDKWRDADQDQGQNQAPLRRSARIASMKRSAEPLPTESASNKKSKGKTIPRAAALKTRPAPKQSKVTHRHHQSPQALRRGRKQRLGPDEDQGIQERRVREGLARRK